MNPHSHDLHWADAYHWPYQDKERDKSTALINSNVRISIPDMTITSTKCGEVPSFIGNVSMIGPRDTMEARPMKVASWQGLERDKMNLNGCVHGTSSQWNAESCRTNTSVWKLYSIVGLAWQLCNFIFVQWKISIRMPRLAKCLPGGRYQLVWVTWGIGLEPEKTSPTGQSLMHFHSFKLSQSLKVLSYF